MTSHYMHPHLRSGDHEYSGYPTIRTIDGAIHHVDANGIISPSRRLESPPAKREIDDAMRWLATMTPAKSCTIGSYGAKHAAERWAGRYVSNGAMIVAVDRAGYRQEHRPHDGLNTGIGIDRRAYRAIVDQSTEVSI